MSAPAELAARRPEPPPTTLRVVMLITRLSLKRVQNRLAHLRAPRRWSARREAVARKPTGGKLFLAFLSLIFLFQTLTATTQLVQRTARAAERRAESGSIAVSDATLEVLYWAEYDERDVPKQKQLSSARVHSAFEAEAAELSDAPARAARVAWLERAFEQRGAAGFRASELGKPRILPDSELWFHDPSPFAMLGPLAVVAGLLSFAIALQQVAGSDRDLARVDSGLEWLFAFPVPARSLFLARALEGAFSGPLIWVLLFPFYGVIYCCAGFGLWSVLLAALAAFYMGALAGALRVASETFLRRALTLANVARVQAVLLAVSYVVMMASFAIAYSPRVEWLARVARALPLGVLVNPLTLPIWAAERGVWRVASLAGTPLAGVVLVALAVLTAERMVRNGLSFGAGPLAAERGRQAGIARGRSFLRGVARKEFLGLLRDRQLRTQAIITPVLILCMQLWMNPRMFSGVGSNPRHAATLAFAIAMLVLSTGGCGALAMEGPTLWMLYTAPQKLERLLIAKLSVWIGLATLFATALLAFILFEWPGLALRTLPYFLLVLVGVGLYSVIALGLGALGTDPLEAEPRRRVRVGVVYLFMILASLYGYALYGSSLWAKFVQLVLSALLAFALWQKVKDHLPFLLDPTEAPPPRIAVADGIMAALGFFVLQGLGQLVLSQLTISEGESLLIAFVVAGLGVALVTLSVFYRNGVPDLLRAVGLRQPKDYGVKRTVLAILGGLSVGAIAAAFAMLYLQAMIRVPWLKGFHDEVLDSAKDNRQLGVRLFMLAVFAAPLFEEFIFRGVLFGGLRRSLGPRVAAVASALVFALVHPAVSALPVFVLALLAALAYERSRWLVTPIFAHMSYNAIVVGSALLH